MTAVPWILVSVAACDPPSSGSRTAGKPEFVGSAACEGCHAPEYRQWLGSHHERAMQVASNETVLGDFSGADFDYFGESIRFYRENGHYMVRTKIVGGESEVFRISHTFGVSPLQQYLVGFPDGRKQAFPIVWDTRPAEDGGQRWYHLYPDEHIGPGDPLHWRQRFFNWNRACAECHSTDVEPNYSMESDTFSTTYEEISVGCEACHGPGSNHLQQTRTGRLDPNGGFPLTLDDRDGARWIIDSENGIARRSRPAAKQRQPEACGRCHSRRSVLSGDYAYGGPLTDTHLPALLDEGLYFADGRIQDEVYVYGSFLQSRMYRAGVTCTDCHNPHTAELVSGEDRNAVCAGCHLPTRFATPGHSGGRSTDCVSCHMTSRVYMGVDERHDHSFRTPGAGAADNHYGPAIAAGRQGPANEQILRSLTDNDHPAIARATLLTLLAPEPAAVEALAKGVDDPDPLVRIGALRSLRDFPVEVRLRTGVRVLADEVRGVRIEAAAAYSDIHDLLPLDAARAFSHAADDYREAQLASASMPESLTVLAEFESQLGNEALAKKYLQHGLRLDPGFAPARHGFGLLLVRLGRHDDALEQLRLAHELDPDNSRYTYTFGVALHSLGLAGQSIELLESARRRFPDDFDIAWALATILRDARRYDEAHAVARELAERFPGNPDVEALLASLRSSHER
jgi:predicted CXXCH cytochrome family protein